MLVRSLRCSSFVPVPAAAAAAASQNIPTVKPNHRQASFGNLLSDMGVSFLQIAPP